MDRGKFTPGKRIKALQDFAAWDNFVGDARATLNYLQQQPEIDPYPGPVLVLQGAKDIQVFANEDTPLLDAALKSRTPDDHQIVIVPNASHNMKFVQDPATDPGITGPVVPEFTNALRTWLARKLSAGAV